MRRVIIAGRSPGQTLWGIYTTFLGGDEAEARAMLPRWQSFQPHTEFTVVDEAGLRRLNEPARETV